MQSNDIADAVALAKKLVATADFIDQHYDIYHDGCGATHYVNGPACKQLHEISMQLTYALSDMRRGTATALPAMPEDADAGHEDGEYEIQEDVAAPVQTGGHQARVVRTK